MQMSQIRETSSSYDGYVERTLESFCDYYVEHVLMTIRAG